VHEEEKEGCRGEHAGNDLSGQINNFMGFFWIWRHFVGLYHSEPNIGDNGKLG
jgi:hypothetical protein